MADGQKGINLTELIKNFEENDELTPGEKLGIFVAMIDHKILMQEMRTNAMLVQTGIQPPSPVMAFAAAVLRIGRPELFVDEEENDGQPGNGA